MVSQFQFGSFVFYAIIKAITFFCCSFGIFLSFPLHACDKGLRKRSLPLNWLRMTPQLEGFPVRLQTFWMTASVTITTTGALIIMGLVIVSLSELLAGGDIVRSTRTRKKWANYKREFDHSACVLEFYYFFCFLALGFLGHRLFASMSESSLYP